MTECRNGHPWTPENTGRTRLGHRVCRACNRAAVARYRAKTDLSLLPATDVVTDARSATFNSRVHKTDDCWLWTGTTQPSGYGVFAIGSRIKVYAHRYAWMAQHSSPIPSGMEIDHLCRVRGCVRPDHLEAVTHTENVRRQHLAAGHNLITTGA